MPKQTEPHAPIVLRENTIIDNKWFAMGEPLPFERIQDLPPSLRPLVVSDSLEEPEEPNEARGSFEMGVPYELTEDGRLGRARKRSVERQVSELESLAQEQQWLEEQAANEELPEEIVADLEDAHKSHVAQQTAQMAVDAARADAVSDAAAEAAKPPEIFVRRGSRHYVETHKAKLRPAEPVFLKNADGGYEAFGICDAKAQPPTPPIIL